MASESSPRDSSGTTNTAREDALAGRKADTQNWSDEARQTYEKVHGTTKRSG